MADTASLIARVKTEGAEQSAKQLDNFATSAGKADTASGKMGNTVAQQQSKLKGFGTNAQQVGYQVQDMIVQIQGGTSWFTAFGQQGSQLAGILGPGGAVIGAVIALSAAVGGTLYKALGDAKVGSEELQAATKTLQGVLQTTKSGAYEVSDAIQTMALSGASAAEIDARFADAQAALQTKLKASAEAAQEATEATTTWMNGSAIGAARSMELGQNVSSLSGFLDNLSSSLGLTADEARTLTPLLAAVQKEATPENIKALAAETDRLTKVHKGENDNLRQLNSTLQQHAGVTRDAEASDRALAQAKANVTKRIQEQNDAIIKNVQIGNLAEKDRVAAMAAADKEAFAKREGVTKEQTAAYNAARDEEAAQDLARIKKSEDAKTAAAAAGAARREEIAARKEENAAKRAAKEQERQAKAEQMEVERAQRMMEREAEQRQAKQDSADSFIEQLRAQNEGELAEIDRQMAIKQQKLDDFHQAGFVSEKDYQKSIQNIQEEAEKKKNDVYMGALNDMTGNLKTALGENNALYKAAAITQTIIETYKGAQAAFSALAPIPIVGPVLGGAAAAAAVAAGMARVGQIRSAREQGGDLAAGNIAMVGERNKAELIMPAGASRVRTMEQVQQMMGGKGGQNNGIPQISIINQTSGRIDSVQQEQDDQGRITLLIREVVSSDLQDSNSRITKSRRATRGQPGFQ